MVVALLRAIFTLLPKSRVSEVYQEDRIARGTFTVG